MFPNQPGVSLDVRWWCVEIQRAGRKSFIGRVEATEAELRQTFPHCMIEGNLVTIFLPTIRRSALR